MVSFCLTRSVIFQLWTAKSSRDFLEKEYPWFLKTYDTYPFGVQRVDALRYFLMRHFGGIYIDLDNVRPSLLPPKILFRPQH